MVKYKCVHTELLTWEENPENCVKTVIAVRCVHNFLIDVVRSAGVDHSLRELPTAE